MNLIKDPWIPVQRKSGSETLIAPWQLTETHDPVIALSAPRPDFSGALMQFLIGLLQTTATPDDNNCWLDWLESPPNPEQLKACFEQYAYAFELQAEQGAFMQDFDTLEDTKPWAIERLLIDAPGENTLENNKDHFVKRERVTQLCPACTATALFTLQVNSPGGGTGYRTSVRGGGPLTTLVILDENSDLPADLWRNLWLNVLERPDFETLTVKKVKTKPADIFPWLDKTRTSERGQITTPIDVNPLQMYWGMPRRIRINWEMSNKGHCDICGAVSERLVTHYQTKNYGINYTEAWQQQHPLSPTYYKKGKKVSLTQHVQPGGLTYQHWFDVGDSDNKYCAKVVRRYYAMLDRWNAEGSVDEQGQFRLYAFGYDMDNMKARCWYETTFPLYTIPETIRVNFSKRIQELTETADRVAGFVEQGIKEVWLNLDSAHKNKKERKANTKDATRFLRQGFYQNTESTFYQSVKSLQVRLPNGTDKEILQEWHGTLRNAALHLFDYWSIRGDFTQANPRRVAEARDKLKKQICGKNIRQKLQLADKTREAA